MPSISDYFKYAETAFAAYAFDLAIGKGNISKYIAAEMTSSQAQRFDAAWQVLGQQELWDGFSAVLLQPVDAQGDPAGQKVLAIRGTEASHWGIDFLADVVNIALLGTSAGMRQYASLEGFYHSLIAAGKLGASESIVTTGHSLGGFLAQAFAGKHDTVSATYTYNAPGFTIAVGVPNVGTEVLELFGLNGSIPDDKIFNARALDGISATAGLGQMLGSVQTFNIEGTNNPVANHSIATLTDALAVYSLYAKLSPAFTNDQITTLLKASTNTSERTLESALDALRTLLLGTAATQANPTKYAGADARESLYSNLANLQGSTAYQTLAGSAALRLTAAETADSVAQEAKDDFGWFLAVRDLLPIAIEGGGGSLIGANQDLYSQWSADRSERMNDSGNLNFSDNYLADRASMLTYVMAANLADTSRVENLALQNDWYYQDVTTQQAVRVSGTPLDLGIDSGERMVVFGRDQIDSSIETLTGRKLADRLHSGAGADILTGNAGDDYLEGGTGDDILRGGAGNDTYRIDKNSGSDTIIDHAPESLFDNTDSGGDGQGTIVYNGQTLTGTLTQDGTSRSLYHYTPDPTLVIRYIGMDGGRGNLLIMDPTGAKITLLDWKSGELGLTLSGSAATTQPATDLLGTDLADNGELPVATPHNGTLDAAAANRVRKG